MARDSTPGPQSGGSITAGVLALLFMTGALTFYVGFMRVVGERLDPCVEEASVPCARASGAPVLIAGLAMLLIAAAGLSYRILQRTRRSGE